MLSEDVWGRGDVTPCIINPCERSAAGPWAITPREQVVVPAGEEWWNPNSLVRSGGTHSKSVP